MAFIAAPSFTDIYNTNIITLNAPLGHSMIGNQPAPLPEYCNADVSYSMPYTLNTVNTIGVTANGSIDHGTIIVPTTSDGAKRKKLINPFDPECAVPLPFQLEDQFGPFTTTVWKRNQRERDRVKCLNDGYQMLRMHLPVGEDVRRISKVDTLRLTVRYIRHLKEILKNENHMAVCKCFEKFTEQSEGNVRIFLCQQGKRY